ncbi:MAG: hypothetical protein AAF558_09660, partial [Verrucomicrobiota bacterium]
MRSIPIFELLILITVIFAIVQRSYSATSPRIEKPFAFSNETETPPHSPSSIRICCWNIEWFPAGQRKSQNQNVNWQVA